jgi:hypothetical protein
MNDGAKLKMEYYLAVMTKTNLIYESITEIFCDATSYHCKKS